MTEGDTNSSAPDVSLTTNNPASHYVEYDGHILAGPMSQDEARKFVVDASALDVTPKERLGPICPTCGARMEVAVRSSNIEGHLCPVCDDPTVSGGEQ